MEWLVVLFNVRVDLVASRQERRVVCQAMSRVNESVRLLKRNGEGSGWKVELYLSFRYEGRCKR